MKLIVVSTLNYISSVLSFPTHVLSWNLTSHQVPSFILFLFSNPTLWFAIKFLLIIAFLILIRGGTPRYRYDYLTKLGWLKFLTLVVWIFLTLMVIYFLL